LAARKPIIFGEHHAAVDPFVDQALRDSTRQRFISECDLGLDDADRTGRAREPGQRRSPARSKHATPMQEYAMFHRRQEEMRGRCLSVYSHKRKSECQLLNFPGFAGHRPAFHGGFCVSRWAILHGRRMPADLPVGRDLTIRCKIESGRYYCAFCRLKAHHRIWAPRRAQPARS
jgi:hypothetical protein